ncbi:MAG TPA: hypothetical protein VIT62_02910, partial [Lysobacter sp.]
MPESRPAGRSPDPLLIDLEAVPGLTGPVARSACPLKSLLDSYGEAWNKDSWRSARRRAAFARGKSKMQDEVRNGSLGGLKV